MDLYLMQHGVAVPEEEDPERPLSEAGQEGVQKVVERARAAGVRIDLCLHSGKRRAEQTALALAIGLDIPQVRLRDGLNPSDEVGPFAQGLQDEVAGSIAVVGHLPFLDRLASLLVAGDESSQVVRFQNAGLVKLVPKKDAEGCSVAWALVPDLE